MRDPSSPDWPVSKQFHVTRRENEALKRIAISRDITLTQLLGQMVKATIERDAP